MPKEMEIKPRGTSGKGKLTPEEIEKKVKKFKQEKNRTSSWFL